ncbi:MAG: isocitrate lyase/phosphoenolpyruvate mutase family protein, partial [Actinomycetota bacterium]
DQAGAKRCGHRPNKEVVSKKEMVDRIKAAKSARGDNEFYLIARTDAVAVEGIESAIERALAYLSAGADAIFAEAITTLDDYRRFTSAVKAPVLANITEFGLTPLFTIEELRSANIAMALYPLSAFRAMNKAAEKVFETIRKDGTQKSLVGEMQTREELYERINYYEYEKALDKFNSEKRGE